MRVYLVNPPANNGIEMVREGRCMQRKGAWTTVWPPVTLATMAGMLLGEGIEVKLSDCIVEGINFEQLGNQIRKFMPDLLVINTATASIYSDLLSAGIAKDISSSIKTLAFGLQVTALPDEAFALEEHLDFVIRGEPEFCLRELVKSMRGGGNFSGIEGLSYRQNSKIRHNVNRPFEQDLNELGVPAWELIDTKNYLLPLSEEPFLLITTSKGCPHSCVFCPAKPFYGSKLRLRAPQVICEELSYVKEKIGVRQFLIWSESFTEDRDYVISLCQNIIDKKLEIKWVCNSRVDKVDLEMLEIMKKAGCWMIGYGIESGEQKILDGANKGVTVEQIEQAITLANRVGLEIAGHVIFGLPGETKETARKTIRWLNKLPINFAQFYCAVPWPTTQLYSIARENRWLVTDNWEFFEQNKCILNTGKIGTKDVERLRRKAMASFYLSPARIIRLARKIDSLAKARSSVRMVKEFITWA